jgi:hypothetical protein
LSICVVAAFNCSSFSLRLRHVGKNSGVKLQVKIQKLGQCSFSHATTTKTQPNNNLTKTNSYNEVQAFENGWTMVSAF